MAYSEELAARIREAIEVRSGVTERKMFGDVAWMINGNVAVGTLGENLMVRLAPEDVEAALREPFVGPADPTGRRMHDYLTIDAEAIADDAALAGWVDAAADHAASLRRSRPISRLTQAAIGSGRRYVARSAGNLASSSMPALGPSGIERAGPRAQGRAQDRLEGRSRHGARVAGRDGVGLLTGDVAVLDRVVRGVAGGVDVGEALDSTAGGRPR